jgi:hypothetical protein
MDVFWDQREDAHIIYTCQAVEYPPSYPRDRVFRLEKVGDHKPSSVAARGSAEATNDAVTAQSDFGKAQSGS